VHRRRIFLEEFEAFVKREYRLLAGESEEPAIAYATFAHKEEGESVEEIALQYRRGLERSRGEEIRRGISLLGPHRDEMQLTLNGNSLQQFASQGQHKTFLIALKLAEFLYMRERGGEAPLLLLDDVFSELDQHRAERILRRIGDLGQSIITATDERSFHGAVPWNGDHRRFAIAQGTSRPIPRSPEERVAGAGSSGA
jgi:DNA replication and repair protein RecF